MLQTFNGFSQRYQRWQMARNNQQYTWELPAHEVFEPPEGATTGQAYYEGIINLARKEGDGPKEGASRNTTYIRWFKEWEATHEKTNRYYARNLFYLAQALEESGNLPEGIRYYKERLNYEGSYQEKYIARLRLSRIYKNVQAFDEAIKYAEEAEKMVPNRLEAYLEHMYCLDTQKNFKDAYFVGIRGLQHGRLNPTDLFVEYDVYDWKFMLHIMLMGHYSGNDVGAYNLAKKFMEEKKYPTWFASQAESNFKIIEGKYLSSLAVVSEPKGVAEDRFSGFSPVVDDSPIKLPTNRLPALIIIDNFFEDPDAVRKLALSSEFNVKGNYPGGRTKSFATPGHKAALERILGRKITYWPGDYNGSFQYAYGAHKSWIHRDSTDFLWSYFYRLTRPSTLERSCTVTSLQGRRLRLLRTKTFSTMIRMPTIDGRLRTRLGTSITGLLSSMGSNHTNRVTISATTLIIAAFSCYSSSMWRSKLGNYNSCVHKNYLYSL